MTSRFGSEVEADGHRFQLFAPDDDGTPFLIAVMKSSARSAYERKFLGAVANRTLATIHGWQGTDHPFAMRDYSLTLAIALADGDGEANAFIRPAITKEGGVICPMIVKREWSGDVLGMTPREAKLTFADRVDDTIIHELCHLPERASHLMATHSGVAGTDVSQDTSDELVARFIHDIRTRLPGRSELANLPSGFRDCDVDLCRTLTLAIRDGVTVDDTRRGVSGSYARLARTTTGRSAIAYLGEKAGESRRNFREEQYEIASTVVLNQLVLYLTDQDYEGRHRENWAVFANMAQQIPGLLPSVDKYVRDRTEAMRPFATLTQSPQGKASTFPSVYTQQRMADDGWEQIATFACEPRIEAPSQPWTVPIRSISADLHTSF